MFVYPFDSDFIGYEPRIHQWYPRTRNVYRPAQYYRPCSYYHNNASPFYYSVPQNYFDYDDEEDQNEQLLQELLKRKMAYKQQEEREREQQERKAEEQSQQLKRSFKIKIQGGDDEEKSEIKRSQEAARKIFNFIKNQTANKQTRKILEKFHTLRTIENELKEVQDTKFLGNLTFDEEREKREKRVLPISVDNKRFLEYEDKILKLFDKLDRVQSEGIDIIRERRKLLVKSAQALLEELDNEKDNQWKAFSKKQLNSDVVMDDAEKSDEGYITPSMEGIEISMPSSVPENNGDVIADEEQIDSEELIL